MANVDAEQFSSPLPDGAGGHPRGVEGANYSAHTGAGNSMGADSQFIEDFKHRDERHSPHPAAS